MNLDLKIKMINIAGFPPHPHRGIETVTYMLAGDFEHKDSTGGEGRMTAGDVQWMKTGSGNYSFRNASYERRKTSRFPTVD